MFISYASICFPSTSDTHAASVKSRSRGVITWRDAFTQLRTHQLPPGCLGVAKALSTHSHHGGGEGGVLLRSGGRLRREVTVGCDSGGRCQASFRICSLRSSCCIFYWRNKRTACYFHTRAISLRAAAKETRWDEEDAGQKQTSSFRNTKRLHTQTSVAASLLVMFLRSKVASDGSAGGLFANSSSRQING